MSTKLYEVMLKETQNKYEYILWADKDSVEVAKKVDGVNDIWNSFGNQYVLNIDPRYDVDSVLLNVIGSILWQKE